MENGIAELGWIGIFMVMVFQYIIKPLITYLIDKGRPDRLKNLECQIDEMFKVYSLKDDKQRPIVWGYHISEAVDRMVDKIDELIKELK